MLSKTTKYGNRKVDYQGVRFDSIRERDRYIFLMSQQEQGLISNLQRQVRFELIPQQYYDEVQHSKRTSRIVRRVLFRPITYTCDFAYTRTATGEYVVEDVKPSKYLIPKEFLIKEKLLHYFKRIPIRKVFKPTEPI